MSVGSSNDKRHATSKFNSEPENAELQADSCKERRGFLALPRCQRNPLRTRRILFEVMPFPVRFMLSVRQASPFFKDNALDFPEPGSHQTCGTFVVTPEFRISRSYW